MSLLGQCWVSITVESLLSYLLYTDKELPSGVITAGFVSQLTNIISLGRSESAELEVPLEL